MSKVNPFYNAEKFSMLSNASEMGGDNGLKACPGINWSLDNLKVCLSHNEN